MLPSMPALEILGLPDCCKLQDCITVLPERCGLLRVRPRFQFETPAQAGR